MTVQEIAVRPMAASEAGQAPNGLDRHGCSAPLTAVAQPGGTLALRAHDVTCRAPACALWTGPGM